MNIQRKVEVLEAQNVLVRATAVAVISSTGRLAPNEPSCGPVSSEDRPEVADCGAHCGARETSRRTPAQVNKDATLRAEQQSKEFSRLRQTFPSLKCDALDDRWVDATWQAAVMKATDTRRPRTHAFSVLAEQPTVAILNGYPGDDRISALETMGEFQHSCSGLPPIIRADECRKMGLTLQLPYVNETQRKTFADISNDDAKCAKWWVQGCINGFDSDQSLVGIPNRYVSVNFRKAVHEEMMKETKANPDNALHILKAVHYAEMSFGLQRADTRKSFMEKICGDPATSVADLKKSTNLGEHCRLLEELGLSDDVMLKAGKDLYADTKRGQPVRREAGKSRKVGEGLKWVPFKEVAAHESVRAFNLPTSPPVFYENAATRVTAPPGLDTFIRYYDAYAHRISTIPNIPDIIRGTQQGSGVGNGPQQPVMPLIGFLNRFLGNRGVLSPVNALVNYHCNNTLDPDFYVACGFVMDILAEYLGPPAKTPERMPDYWESLCTYVAPYAEFATGGNGAELLLARMQKKCGQTMAGFRNYFTASRPQATAYLCDLFALYRGQKKENPDAIAILRAVGKAAPDRLMQFAYDPVARCMFYVPGSDEQVDALFPEKFTAQPEACWHLGRLPNNPNRQAAAAKAKAFCRQLNQTVLDLDLLPLMKPLVKP